MLLFTYFYADIDSSDMLSMFIQGVPLEGSDHFLAPRLQGVSLQRSYAE